MWWWCIQGDELWLSCGAGAARAGVACHLSAGKRAWRGERVSRRVCPGSERVFCSAVAACAPPAGSGGRRRYQKPSRAGRSASPASRRATPGTCKSSTLRVAGTGGFHLIIHEWANGPAARRGGRHSDAAKARGKEQRPAIRRARNSPGLVASFPRRESSGSSPIGLRSPHADLRNVKIGDASRPFTFTWSREPPAEQCV